MRGKKAKQLRRNVIEYIPSTVITKLTIHGIHFPSSIHFTNSGYCDCINTETSGADGGAIPTLLCI